MLLVGDNLGHLREMPADSVDAIVTDPPYELGFMGKSWDSAGVAYEVERWAEMLRVAKPGAHLIAFAGSRTYHRIACAIEDAGWEIRDQGMWLYGSGFPKSSNIGKQIDKAGADGSKQWDGWGSALKPAHEPFVIARKPFKGPLFRNVMANGCGGLNIDACRVDGDSGRWPANVMHDGSEAVKGVFPETGKSTRTKRSDGRTQAKDVGVDFGGGVHGPDNSYCDEGNASRYFYCAKASKKEREMLGRWPANVMHDGSEAVKGVFPETKSGKMMPTKTHNDGRLAYGSDGSQGFTTIETYGDSGNASRYFYCAKASKKEREKGLDAVPAMNKGGRRNIHPTVKPISLMRYLVRLICPPNGVVLDPYTGSGSTGVAATLEGFDFIGIELETPHAVIAHERIKNAEDERC